MKHPRRKPVTPRSQVKSALHRLWARCRERNAALQSAHYTCQICHRKRSKAKGKEFDVEVHHKHGIDWEDLVNLVIARLLPDPSELEVLCPECHDKLHQK